MTRHQALPSDYWWTMRAMHLWNVWWTMTWVSCTLASNMIRQWSRIVIHEMPCLRSRTDASRSCNRFVSWYSSFSGKWVLEQVKHDASIRVRHMHVISHCRKLWKPLNSLLLILLSNPCRLKVTSTSLCPNVRLRREMRVLRHCYQIIIVIPFFRQSEYIFFWEFEATKDLLI
jgi:hypothetical protein